MLNYNYNIFNNASSSAGDLFPFPVDLGDVFLKKTDPGFESGPAAKPPQSLNIGPGLYAIICSATNKIYFGESVNVVTRLGGHFDDLVAGVDESVEMQNDWNEHGQSSFTFISLSVGQHWIETPVRCQAETRLIQLNIHCVYNRAIAGSTPKRPADIYRKVVSYKGTVYKSIAEASRQTGVSETHIRRLLRDQRNEDWEYVRGSDNELNDSLIINIDAAIKVK